MARLFVESIYKRSQLQETENINMARRCIESIYHRVTQHGNAYVVLLQEIKGVTKYCGNCGFVLLQESGPLLSAAEAGHRDAVLTLLARGALPNASDARGASPLMRAAGQGHRGCCEALLASGASKNSLAAECHNPLILLGIQTLHVHKSLHGHRALHGQRRLNIAVFTCVEWCS